MSAPGFCCDAYGDNNGDTVYPEKQQPLEGPVFIAQEELYRKLMDAALASNNTFVYLCKMFHMGFRDTELVGRLVRFAEEEEPAFKFSHMKILVDMGVLVPIPPLVPALGAPAADKASLGRQPKPKSPLFGLCGLRAKKHPGDETWAWGSARPAARQSGYN